MQQKLRIWKRNIASIHDSDKHGGATGSAMVIYLQIILSQSLSIIVSVENFNKFNSVQLGKTVHLLGTSIELKADLAYNQVNCADGDKDSRTYTANSNFIENRNQIIDYAYQSKLFSRLELRELHLYWKEYQHALKTLSPNVNFRNSNGKFNNRVLRRYILGQIYKNRIEQMNENNFTHICLKPKVASIRGITETVDHPTKNIKHFWIVLFGDAVQININIGNVKRTACNTMAVVCNSEFKGSTETYLYDNHKNILFIDTEESRNITTIFTYSVKDNKFLKQKVFRVNNPSSEFCKANSSFRQMSTSIAAILIMTILTSLLYI
ncbi:hypothetical protein GJ496_005447 [Pomphorhynchus laevis]|nr:hypothetical protein GJ496_005447 [Pomphorhynchus laevis]